MAENLLKWAAVLNYYDRKNIAFAIRNTPVGIRGWLRPESLEYATNSNQLLFLDRKQVLQSLRWVIKKESISDRSDETTFHKLMRDPNE